MTTDPRAALAEAFVWQRDLADGSPSGMPDFPRTVERLAERGVLLNRKGDIEKACIEECGPWFDEGHESGRLAPMDLAQRIIRRLAALSGEVTEKTPGHGVGCNCVNCEPGPFAP